jgi:hypothetical protein
MVISVAKEEPRQALAYGALLNRGRGYFADECTGIAVVADYVSPNSGLAAFGVFLDEDGECVERCFPRQVLILGNFNAHSTQSGNSATYTRGRRLTDWARDSNTCLRTRVRRAPASHGGGHLWSSSRGPSRICTRGSATGEWPREWQPCPITYTYLLRWSRRTWTRTTAATPQVEGAAPAHHHYRDGA